MNEKIEWKIDLQSKTKEMENERDNSNKTKMKK